ncbi:DUF4494 family protein [Spirosoma litoris]
MLAWYRTKVNYWAKVEGQRKVVSEEYVLMCVDFGDVQYTITGLIQDRIQKPDIDSIGKIKLSDVYIKASVDGVDSEFYLVVVETEDGDKKPKETHLLNANSAKNAIERVTARMKNSGLKWKIIKTERTKILGIFDKLREDLVDDFMARQEHLADLGKVEADLKQYGVFESDEEKEEREARVNRKAAEAKEDEQNASTELAIRSDSVVSVDGEDLGNGHAPESEEYFEAIVKPELPTGEIKQLPTGEESPTETTDEPEAVAV